MDRDDFAARRLVEVIRNAFPDDAAWVDTQTQAQGFERTEAPYIWVGQFSQCTTNSMKGHDQTRAESHLGLMSAQLSTADSPTVRCIDVAYSETLMWDLDDERKRQCWPLIPQNLQELYIGMWGEQPTMRKHGHRTK